MNLHFVLNQDYQKHAIDAIVDIFEGQSLSINNLEFTLNECSLQFSENGVGNRILLTEKQVLKNFFALIGIICKLNAPY